MDTIAKREEEVKQEAFMGVLKMTDEQKKYLLEIIYSYLFVYDILTRKKKLVFDEAYMSGVVGMLHYTNENLDWGMRIGNVMVRGEHEEIVEFFEELDLRALPKIASEMKNIILKVNAEPESMMGRMAVWLRFHSWAGTLLSFTSWFLYIFIFLSILYVLVATDWGRSLAWSFLDVYGAIIRMLMYILMGVAFVLIIAFVSFMYLESKAKK